MRENAKLFLWMEFDEVVKLKHKNIKKQLAID